MVTPDIGDIWLYNGPRGYYHCLFLKRPDKQEFIFDKTVNCWKVLVLETGQIETIYWWPELYIKVV